MRLHFIDYANAKFSSIQAAQLRCAQQTGTFDTVYGYTREWLESTAYYMSNRDILDRPRGGGYWAWKPFIILDALRRTAPGDVVVYMDAGDRFTRLDMLRDFILHSLLQADFGLRMQGEFNGRMTKRDCFVRMGCDTERYWNAKQPEAGFLVMRAGSTVWNIVAEWLDWCRDSHVLTDDPNICGLPNRPDFIDHRHDQSILTNLITKYGVSIDQWMHYCVDTNANMPENV
jgi:hypothetical protein